MNRSLLFLLATFLIISTELFAQPSILPEGVRFVYDDPSATTVSLVGDFNSWSQIANPMKKTATGQWNVTISLRPGSYQYAFMVDGDRIQIDPNNLVTFEVIDGSRLNSLLTISENNTIVTEGYPTRRNLNDTYQRKDGTVYLNLVFKHHLPLYYNAKKDQIDAPFVRMHATRDYFELADVILRYPDVHATTVLSPTLLWQIQEIYVNRMEPFIKKNKSMRAKPATMDAAGFLARMKGKTDPWIDICLTPAERLSEEDKAYLYKNEWNAFTISPVRMNRFPEFMKLHEKWKDAKGNPNFTVQELRTLKFFAIVSHFDTEFFERIVPLIQTGTRIKRSLGLRDLISYRSDGKYYLKNEVTEENCVRVVASAYYIMASILPAFDKAKFNARANIGQMELAATSYADAVLPLIINSDVAKEADPSITLPGRYAYPEDAEAQLHMSLAAYQKYFNYVPSGYVPPYGAMSAEVIPILKKTGFNWFASDEAVLRKTSPGLEVVQPYTVNADGSSMTGVFSNDLLTTRINWVYRNYYAENSANDFIENLLSMAPAEKGKDVLVTVVIDNDDAWLNYERDTDGKGLINGVYRKLNKLFQERSLISVTMSEYIEGNRTRGIPAHPVSSFGEINNLAPGSRFEGNFDVWIGREGSNKAWSMIKTAREALGRVATPVATMDYLENQQARPYALFFGTTSPHWFQSFGGSSVLAFDAKQYESHFLTMLRETYENAGLTAPAMEPFISPSAIAPQWAQPKQKTRVTFTSKLVDREAITHVFIAGNRKELGNLEPNTIPMWDNGENGDEIYGNNVWTLVVDLEPGDIIYKYTNSGGQGTWDGSEAFPNVWRKVTIAGEKMTIDDVFARLSK